MSVALTGSIQKTYDGNTDAALTSANYNLTGFVTVGGVTEGATITQTLGAYNSRNVLEANSVAATLAASPAGAIAAGRSMIKAASPT